MDSTKFEYDEEVDLRSAVFQALGAASVCWDDMSGAGVFNSNRAVSIGEALLEKIYELTGFENG